MMRSDQFQNFRERLRDRGVTLQTQWIFPLEHVGAVELFQIYGGKAGAPYFAIALHSDHPRDGYNWYPISSTNRIDDDVDAIAPPLTALN